MRKFIFVLAAAGLALGLNAHSADFSDSDDEAILLFSGDETPGDALEMEALAPDEITDAARMRIRCESRGYGTTKCRVNGQIRSVTLTRRLSFAPCIAGRTFGATPRYVWVRNGCSGQFLVRFDRWGGGGH